MPSARASRRGFALNCRFAVNGIQNASRSPLAGAGVSWAFIAGSLRYCCDRMRWMIRKIDTQLNFCVNVTPTVYYNRHYEPGRGYPFEGRATNVRAVAARAGEASGCDQRFDFVDRTESSEPFGEFPEKSARRYSDGARRLLHAGSRRPASSVFSSGRTERYRHRERRAAPGRQPSGQTQYV